MKTVGLGLHRIILLWMILLAGPTCAAPADLLKRVAAQVQPAPIIAGNFEQVQEVTVLSRPLQSHGRFVFQRGRGIFWQTLEPVPSSLVLRADGEVATGEGTAIAGARALGFVASLLNNVLSGNVAELEGRFHVAGEVMEEGWSLQLTPRERMLSRVIDHIALHGQATIEEVRVRDTEGDQSILRFSQVSFPTRLPEYAVVLEQ